MICVLILILLLNQETHVISCTQLHPSEIKTEARFLAVIYHEKTTTVSNLKRVYDRNTVAVETMINEGLIIVPSLTVMKYISKLNSRYMAQTLYMVIILLSQK